MNYHKQICFQTNYSSSCVYHQYVVITSNQKIQKLFKTNKIPFGRHYPEPNNLKALKKCLEIKNIKFEILAHNGTSLPSTHCYKRYFKICNIINKFS